MHLKLKDQELKTILFIQTSISKPHDNHNLKIYNRYTHKRKGIKHKIKISHQITIEHNKRGREEKRCTKTNPKQLKKWQ